MPMPDCADLDIVYVSSEDDIHLVKGGIGTAVGLFANTLRDHFPDCRVHWISESPRPEAFVERSGTITRHYLNRWRRGARLPLSQFSLEVDRRLRAVIAASTAAGRRCIVEAADWEGLAEPCFSRPLPTGVRSERLLKISRLHTPMAVCSQLNRLPRTAENLEQMRREHRQLLASDLLSAPTAYILQRTRDEVLGADGAWPASTVIPNCTPQKLPQRPTLGRNEALARLSRLSGLTLRQDAFHVFTLGSLEVRKGARIVQNAVTELFTRFPDCELTWIGHAGESGDLNANTKISAETFLQEIPAALHPRVHLTGYLEHQELLELLPAADLYALCYLGDNFPGALLEIAMASVPMVVLARGGIPEMVQAADGPLAFLIEDGPDEQLPRHLVAAIAQARSQMERARSQAAALRRHVADRFDPVAVTSRLLERYRAQLEAKAAGMGGASA